MGLGLGLGMGAKGKGKGYCLQGSSGGYTFTGIHGGR